jgi:hypothetical protein
MDNHDRLEAVAKADDTANLLDHIAWQAVVKPALIKKRTDYTSILVGAVLGAKMPEGITKEQIAGFVYGIDEIIKTFEKILQHGESALKDLELQGFHLNH